MPPNPPPPDFARILRMLKQYSSRIGWKGIVNNGAVGTTAIAFGYFLYESIFFVQGGYSAVKFNCFTGLSNFSFGEGAHFCIPFVETPVIFDIRNKPIEVPTSSGSRDLQTVNMAVRVLYQPDKENLPRIYRTIGTAYAETVLPSLINEIIRAVIAQFNASDLLMKRPEVSQRIAVMLRERAKRFNIEITDVSITQMSFGKEYTNAVEAKQVAQQMAERAKFKVEQAEQEKQAAVLLAKGEAEAATLVGEAIKKNPAFIHLRSLEASRTIGKLIKESGKGKYYLDNSALLLNPYSQDTSKKCI